MNEDDATPVIGGALAVKTVRVPRVNQLVVIGDAAGRRVGCGIVRWVGAGVLHIEAEPGKTQVFRPDVSAGCWREVRVNGQRELAEMFWV